ncbi:MAG: ATP-binding protein [Bilifractor sp.]
MNIQQAKEQIRQAVTIYLMKDAYGNYRIPLERQRPVFLIGAPGIGKTAIMEQIARELDISLVSYSMTHHTRQSALGLPFITRKTYQGESVNVSEYTMSEIIASMYENMEKSGKKEGILFLDEINCVSETLGPSMLQFLQYKTFGNHQIPRGWVVVTAGNPPEYNRSVHEFDIVTLDRLKVLKAEPDYPTWKKYAEKQGIHKAILSYLDIRSEDFYTIETTVDGKNYVTARGWEDLSEAMYLYEEKGFPIDEMLIGQYLHHPRIASEFATWYQLFRKYREDYQIGRILDGTNDPSIERRAGKAPFDERMTLIRLLTEALLPEIRMNVREETCLKELHALLSGVSKEIREKNGRNVSEILTEEAQQEESALQELSAANGLTDEQRARKQYPIAFIRDCLKKFQLEKPAGSEKEFALVKDSFAGRVSAMHAQTSRISSEITNAFSFISRVFGDGNEMLLLVTELTVNDYSSAFLSEHGNEAYYRYNQKFMLSEREKELSREVNAFEG